MIQFPEDAATDEYEDSVVLASYTPKILRAEWHLTYRCDLECAGCNRACFFPAATRDMTVDDAKEFVRQADSIGRPFDATIVGGEPALHAHLQEIIDIAKSMKHYCFIFSNGYSKDTQAILETLRSQEELLVVPGTIKTQSVVHPITDIFVSPVDCGVLSRMGCKFHAGYGNCGISVDADGYTVCSIGGAIDGQLGLGARTKQLADLFNEDFAVRQTAMLCLHCGKGLNLDKRFPEKCRTYKGTAMSDTWYRVAERVMRGGNGADHSIDA
jgi:hypothetical protein